MERYADGDKTLHLKLYNMFEINVMTFTMHPVIMQRGFKNTAGHINNGINFEKLVAIPCYGKFWFQ